MLGEAPSVGRALALIAAPFLSSSIAAGSSRDCVPFLSAGGRCECVAWSSIAVHQVR